MLFYFMGISLTLLENLSANLLLIFQYTGIFFLCIFCANLLALFLLERKIPSRILIGRKHYSRLHMALESLKLVRRGYCWLPVGAKPMGVVAVCRKRQFRS